MIFYEGDDETIFALGKQKTTVAIDELDEKYDVFLNKAGFPLRVIKYRDEYGPRYGIIFGKETDGNSLVFKRVFGTIRKEANSILSAEDVNDFIMSLECALTRCREKQRDDEMIAAEEARRKAAAKELKALKALSNTKLTDKQREDMSVPPVRVFHRKGKYKYDENNLPLMSDKD